MVSKAAKYTVLPPGVELNTTNLKNPSAVSITCKPDAKYVTDKNGVQFPTHRVLKHGGQVNHVI